MIAAKLNTTDSDRSVTFITFRARRSRGEMYIDHDRLCVCPRRISILGLLHGPGCNLGNGRGALWLCTIGRICNRCTGFVAMTTAPNAKCQRVLILTLCLVRFCSEMFGTRTPYLQSPAYSGKLLYLLGEEAEASPSIANTLWRV